MQRDELKKRFKKLRTELRDNLVAAGVDLIKFDALTTLSTQDDEATLEIYLSKIETLMAPDGAYTEFMSIYGLKEPAWWVNMKNLGHTNLREHILLNGVSKKLRLQWRQIHVGGKKKTKTKHDANQTVTTGITD